MLTVQRWSGEHQLQMWVRPDNYGEYEDEFMAWTMRIWPTIRTSPLRWNFQPITQRPCGSQANGFTLMRSLLTMRKQIDMASRYRNATAIAFCVVSTIGHPATFRHHP